MSERPCILRLLCPELLGRYSFASEWDLGSIPLMETTPPACQAAGDWYELQASRYLDLLMACQSDMVCDHICPESIPLWRSNEVNVLSKGWHKHTLGMLSPPAMLTAALIAYTLGPSALGTDVSADEPCRTKLTA